MIQVEKIVVKPEKKKEREEHFCKEMARKEEQKKGREKDQEIIQTYWIRT